MKPENKASVRVSVVSDFDAVFSKALSKSQKEKIISRFENGESAIVLKEQTMTLDYTHRYLYSKIRHRYINRTYSEIGLPFELTKLSNFEKTFTERIICVEYHDEIFELQSPSYVTFVNCEKYGVEFGGNGKEESEEIFLIHSTKCKSQYLGIFEPSKSNSAKSNLHKPSSRLRPRHRNRLLHKLSSRLQRRRRNRLPHANTVSFSPLRSIHRFERFAPLAQSERQLEEMLPRLTISYETQQHFNRGSMIFVNNSEKKQSESNPHTGVSNLLGMVLNIRTALLYTIAQN